MTTTQDKRPDGRTVAAQQEQVLLQALARFGHLRSEDLRLILWPESRPADGRQMASRLFRRLAGRGLVLERKNSLGGTSYVLSGAGARLVTARTGITVNDGYDIQGVGGPQFWHRSLATAFLLSAFEGPVALPRLWGEYAIAKGWAPVGRAELRDQFLKLPDGLARIPGPETSLAWIEVESSFKPAHELDKLFANVGRWLDTAMDSAETVRLGALWVAFDVSQGHEPRLLKAARRALAARALTRTELVTFWRCQVALPMQLVELEPVTLSTLLAGSGR